MTVRPILSIVSPDTLAVMGLRQLLQNVLPIMTVEAFSSVEELEEAGPELFAHYFVDISVFLTNRPFFQERRRKTIVLTCTPEHSSQLSDFHCICVTQPEAQLVRALLALEQHAHSHGRHLPSQPRPAVHKTLSVREVEVLTLIVQGYINKEIADRLHISLTTVITHRKNIMDKLGIHSVSGLTIYAVVNGYVDMDMI